MLELLMILLGLNFSNTDAIPADGRYHNSQTVGTAQPAFTDPPDTGGETQPIPPRK